MDEILKLFGGAENIWTAIQNNAGTVGIETTRMMLELFYVLKSPETSIIDKTLIVTALGYQLLPEDVLPREKYGILGFLDNIVTIGFAYSKVKSSVTPEIEHQVNNILANWFGVGTSTQQANLFDNANNNSDYTFNPTYYEPKQQQDNSSFGGHQGNPHVSPHHNPIWDDDEDVVID